MIEKAKKTVRHITRRMSLSGLVGVVLIFIVFSLLAGSIQAIQDNFHRQLEVDSKVQEVALLELETETMRFQNNYYKTDEYIDLQARKLLGKAAPGEKVIILPETTMTAPPLESSTRPTNETLLKDRSNIEQWLYFLFSEK